MTVGELVDILSQVDRERTVYVPDLDGTAQIAVAVVDLKHVNLPIEGVVIPDDVAIMTVLAMEESNDE